MLQSKPFPITPTGADFGARQSHHVMIWPAPHKKVLHEPGFKFDFKAMLPEINWANQTANGEPRVASPSLCQPFLASASLS